MTAVTLSAAIWLLAQAPAPDRKAPADALTERQLARLREMVKVTQTEADSLKARLEQAQRDLMRVYNVYELDKEKAEKLQAEIVELQRQTLANYHRMQVELRAIVSKERFVILKQRLDRVFSPEVRKAEPEPKRTETATKPADK